MPSTDILVAFFIAAVLFAYMPGPSTLYAAAQTIARGRRAGWQAALGIHVGGYVHVIATALGLSAIFSAVPALYTALKLAGACYLIWLGVQLFRSGNTTIDTQTAAQQVHNKQTFWRSMTVEVLNPKTAMFYIAFLPQFTDSAAALPLSAQLLLLGTIVNVLFSSADILCVLLAAKVLEFIQQSPQSNRLMQRIGGSILILLGMRLALSHH